MVNLKWKPSKKLMEKDTRVILTKIACNTTIE